MESGRFRTQYENDNNMSNFETQRQKAIIQEIQNIKHVLQEIEYNRIYEIDLKQRLSSLYLELGRRPGALYDTGEFMDNTNVLGRFNYQGKNRADDVTPGYFDVNDPNTVKRNRTYEYKPPYIYVDEVHTPEFYEFMKENPFAEVNPFR